MSNDDTSPIKIFVMQKGNDATDVYGALANYDEEGEEHLIAEVSIENTFGYDCDVDEVFDILESLDQLSDSNQIRDALMVIFTDGFRAGMKQKEQRFREEIGLK
ncbi:MAG TPA: hypothetical protein VLG69_03225 [Candidatus Andersenbacteria bacterium]|nr:hypothetical protein [Candidatus Andersenbacteria bacterium]